MDKLKATSEQLEIVKDYNNLLNDDDFQAKLKKFNSLEKTIKEKIFKDHENAELTYRNSVIARYFTTDSRLLVDTAKLKIDGLFEKFSKLVNFHKLEILIKN